MEVGPGLTRIFLGKSSQKATSTNMLEYLVYHFYSIVKTCLSVLFMSVSYGFQKTDLDGGVVS